jgi:hypothetical protein
MTKDQEQLTAEELEADREFLRVLRTLKDYVPPSPELSIEALDAVETRMLEAEEACAEAEAAYEQAIQGRQEAQRQLLALWLIGANPKKTLSA